MEKKPITVGFIGNPNCGKTTLFNAFTGANLKVGNWPGVTVEKKEGKTTYQGQEFRLIDLPGTYSLTSYTMEETVARECIMSGEVDVIVNVVDASCLERNLYRYGRDVWEEKTEAVQLCEGRSPGEEIGFVCASIWRMVQEEGMRFRDAALITGDLASYKGEIARQFSENGIPYFLDDKKSILENPMVELIRAALDTIRDFSYENV